MEGAKKTLAKLWRCTNMLITLLCYARGARVYTLRFTHIWRA